MTELLALEGPWSVDLLATMTGEAMKIRLLRKKETFVGMISAIGTFFGGGEAGKEYGRALDVALEGLEELKRIRRGEAPVSEAEKAAEKLEKLLTMLPGMKG